MCECFVDEGYVVCDGGCGEGVPPGMLCYSSRR